MRRIAFLDDFTALSLWILDIPCIHVPRAQYVVAHAVWRSEGREAKICPSSSSNNIPLRLRFGRSRLAAVFANTHYLYVIRNLIRTTQSPQHSRTWKLRGQRNLFTCWKAPRCMYKYRDGNDRFIKNAGVTMTNLGMSKWGRRRLNQKGIDI